MPARCLAAGPEIAGGLRRVRHAAGVGRARRTRFSRSARGSAWCRRPGSSPPRAFPASRTEQNGVFVRLVALPAEAFAEIEKTMTNEALQEAGHDGREARDRCRSAAATPSWRSCARTPPAGRIRKWLLIAPIDNLTALVSLEMPAKRRRPIPTSVIRAALTELSPRGRTCRPTSSSRWCRSRSATPRHAARPRGAGRRGAIHRRPQGRAGGDRAAAARDRGRARRPADAATAISSPATR